MAASEPFALNLSDLPDDCVVRILSLISQEQRLTSAALVSKRFYALCCSPQLNPSITARIPGEITASDDRLESLRLWLDAHGQHLQTFTLHREAPPANEDASADGNDGWGWITAREEPHTRGLTDACLAAAARGPLRRLEAALLSPPATMAWLAQPGGPLGASLRQLSLSATGYLQPSLCIDASLHHLAALEELQLQAAGGLEVAPSALLPPNVTCLDISAFSHLPSQVAELRSLAVLRLRRAIIPSPSLAHLPALRTAALDSCMMHTTWLSGLSRLEQLLLKDPTFGDAENNRDSQYAALGGCLSQLQRLTSLALSTPAGVPATAITRLTRLKQLSLRCMPPQPGSALPPPGPWAANLQHLACSSSALLAGMPALAAAPALRCLTVLHETGPDYDALLEAALQQTAQQAWLAMCNFVAHHPPLRALQLSLAVALGASLPPVAAARLEALPHERPGLAVRWLAEAPEDLFQSHLHWTHFMDAAQNLACMHLHM